MYEVVYRKKAIKDIPKIKQSKLDSKVKALVEIIKKDPFQTPPQYEKLLGDLKGAYLRRINIQHRLVYQVVEEEKVVRIISFWSHYESV